MAFGRKRKIAAWTLTAFSAIISGAVAISAFATPDLIVPKSRGTGEYRRLTLAAGILWYADGVSDPAFPTTPPDMDSVRASCMWRTPPNTPSSTGVSLQPSLSVSLPEPQSFGGLICLPPEFGGLGWKVKQTGILLWPPTVACIAGSILLHAVAHRARRRPQAACHHCGYDRIGLSPSQTCPECGKPPPT